MSSQCECGATLACAPLWHAALAAELADPRMYTWHNPLVCAFVLQHRSVFRPRNGVGQLRFLRLFLTEGIDAVNAAARRAGARNRGHGRRVESTSPEDAALVAGGFPELFAVSVHHLMEPAGFLASGYDAYGTRMREYAEATVVAWERPRATPRAPTQRRSWAADV